MTEHELLVSEHTQVSGFEIISLYFIFIVITRK